MLWFVNATLLTSCFCLHASCSQGLISGSTDFSSLPCSSGLQGQQPVQPVKEVQERCQIPEHPLHLRQAGSRGCLFHHADSLCTLLVALRRQSGGKGSTEIENWLISVWRRQEVSPSTIKKGSLLLRLCRCTTAHFLSCLWTRDLNINNVTMHSFIQLYRLVAVVESNWFWCVRRAEKRSSFVFSQSFTVLKQDSFNLL